ncbi:MAG TPA: hypothetical protein VMS22_06855 [Candidatus Eisenbacteria bacterium]|nr:hypothetical protein [Candidatus Eisenbacteria bacterium]
MRHPLPCRLLLLLLLLVLVAAIPAAADLTAERFDAIAIVTTGTILIPASPAAGNILSEVRHDVPNVSKELTVRGGTDTALHFGPGLTSLFASHAGFQGFVRSRMGALRLWVSAFADAFPTRVLLGPNPLRAYAGVSVSGSFSEIVVPPATTGIPVGSPTSLNLHVQFDCVDTSAVPVVGSPGYGLGHVGISQTVGADVFTGDGSRFIDGLGTREQGCGGISNDKVIGGLTAGDPVLLQFGVTLWAIAIAGDYFLSNVGTDMSDNSASGLDTAYVLVTDADGHGVVGQSGFDFGHAPPADEITVTTTTSTSTTFVPPTTLPTCAAEAYCGDGVHQADCGEECDCPMAQSGDVVASCAADVSVPALASACMRCTGCRVDFEPCGTTSTTTSTSVADTSSTTSTSEPGTTSTSTTSAPGSSTTTTTTLPGGCDDLADLAAVECLCAGNTVPACGVTPPPGSVAHPWMQACKGAHASDGATPAKAKKQLARASRLFGKAAAALGRPKVSRRLPAACRDALRALAAELRARVDAARAGL